MLVISTSCLFLLAPNGSPYFHSLLLTKANLPEPLYYFSGQFLHTEPKHLFWNILALAISGTLIEIRSRLFFLSSFVTGILAVAIWFTLESRFDHYAGLSGALNALFVSAIFCLLDFKKLVSKHNLILGLILVLYLGKIFYELSTGSTILSDLEWRTTPGAHLSGMLAGSFVSLIAFMNNHIQKRPLK